MAEDERDVVIPLGGDVDDEMTAWLCTLVRALLEHEAIDVVICDATGADVDVALIGALARMHLTACQLGGTIRIRGGGTDLRRLVDLVGLTGVLRVVPDERPSAGERG